MNHKRYPRKFKTGEVAEIKKLVGHRSWCRNRKLVNASFTNKKKNKVLGIMGTGRAELALSLFGCYNGCTEEIAIEGKKYRSGS